MPGRYSKMDHTCRSPRDREIWFAAEAHAISRWQDKVSRLWVDVTSVRAAVRRALTNVPEGDVKALGGLRDALRSADRLVGFVKEHSGPFQNKLADAPSKDDLG